MKNYFKKREKSKVAAKATQKYFAKYKHIFLKLFNKNIYTRILITNISLFLIVLFILILFANIMLKQATYAQAEQDLLRKAIRVNFALTQENKLTLAGQEQSDSDQDLLKFLADSFDTKITVYDNKGIILRTSAEQEVVPGSKIDPKFTDLFRSGETIVTRSKNNETNQLTFNAAIPMGNTEEQILRNLIKNAVMATENGTIKVSIESENDQIQLVIEDNGTGIPAEDLPQIWERFYQAKNQRSINTEEKGTGLGLVIVKKLVQLQNGTIEAESQLGKGTSFHISFSAFNPYD